MSVTVQAGGITAVIVNYRTPDLALACVAALRREHARLPWLSAILVDGGSADGSAERLAAATQDDRDWLRLMPLEINGGYGWANNQAILLALQSDTPPEHILLLNPDAEVTPGAIEALRAHMATHPRCGAAGSRLVGPEGDVQPSAFRFPTLRSEFADGAQMAALLRLAGGRPIMLPPATGPMQVDWVPGAGVLIRSEVLRQVGLFDDGFFLYYEEVELMWRIRAAGHEVWTVPASTIVHIAGASTGVRGVETRPRPKPDYWYDSHRRLLLRCMGGGQARAAAALWLLGRGLGAVRAALQPAFARRLVPQAGRRFIAAWRRGGRHDGDDAVPTWRDPLARTPRWMARR